MDINKNQQTNTFLKGMNTDTSDFLIPSDQYRYAENLRLNTDNDNNSGELHVVRGVEQLIDTQGIILAMSAIRNYVVYIVYNNDTWSIYRYDKNSNIDSNNPHLVFGPSSEPLWSSTEDLHKKTISIVLRYESNDNIKLYIADGIHELMCINIMEEHAQDTFENVFQYQTVLLPPLSVEIASTSGSIPSGIVQYAYLIYNRYGAASSISILSKPLSLYKDENHGFALHEKSNKAVDITLPSISLQEESRIKIFRISYQDSSALPSVHIIKDQKILSQQTFTDTGYNIEEISSSEFLAAIKVQIKPSEIESKGDYLFAGNLKYQQDQVDSEFQQFDARCYNKGSYFLVNGITKTFDDILRQDFVIGDNYILQHRSFDGSSNDIVPRWSEADWGDININGENWNGVGKNIKWRYVYTNYRQLNKQNNRSYRRGEVYRFGIRLFNEKGYASSVKWIGDILIGSPKRSDENTPIDETVTLQFSVTGLPSSCKGYEIVRCNRTIDDRFTITQGITGYVFQDQKSFLSTPGILAHEQIKLTTATYTIVSMGPLYSNPGDDRIYYSNTSLEDTELDGLREVETSTDYMLFASPEICYQSDDVKNIVKNSSNLYSEIVCVYEPKYNDYFFSSTRQASSQGTKPALSAPMDTGSLFITPSYDVNNNFTIGRCISELYKDDINGLPFLSQPYSSKVNNDKFIFTPSDLYIMGNGGVPSTIENFKIENNPGGGVPTYVYKNIFDCTDSNYKIQSTSSKSVKVKNSVLIHVPKWDEFIKDDSYVYMNNPVFIGNKQYINWSAPFLMSVFGDIDSNLLNSILTNLKNLVFAVWKEDHHRPYTDTDNAYWDGDEGYCLANAMYPISYGGAGLLLELDGNVRGFAHRRHSWSTPGSLNMTSSQNYYGVPSVTVENLMKSATPYGGYSVGAIESSVYYSYGDYAPSTQNTINISSGDCRVQDFIYHAAHFWDNAKYRNNASKMLTVYKVPIESDIDIEAQCGTLYGIDTSNFRLQHNASSLDGYIQEKDAYLYNTAYNKNLDILSHSSLNQDKNLSGIYDTRIHYSEKKTNNEHIDSWSTFKAVNYIDVDSRYGSITEMKLFKDRLLFLQENAIGVLAVNERTLLNTADDAQIILGTGGVLERYDYISHTYGQKKNQHTACVGNDSLYWWDGNLKEIMRYQDGYQATPLSTFKQVKNYINDNSESTMPSVIYDPSHKEVMFNVVGNKSIVFNESSDSFISVYTFAPIYHAFTFDDLYVTDTSVIYKYNTNSSNWFDNPIYPKIKMVVNASSDFNKVFDIQTFGGRLYGGEDLNAIIFKYNTPLKQVGITNGNSITNREYDFRLTIPRNGETIENKVEWGDRLRGKTMQYEISSTSSGDDFSLQYITTKYRMSWT